MVGSYAMPGWLERLKTEYFARRISRHDLDEIYDAAAKAAIKDQEIAGLDIVTDGEPRRDNMVDYFVERLPGVARAAREAGHEIGNHTYSHPMLCFRSPAFMRRELERAQGVIEAHTGARPALFRAPYGAWSSYVLDLCADAGQTPLGWSRVLAWSRAWTGRRH